MRDPIMGHNITKSIILSILLSVYSQDSLSVKSNVPQAGQM